jgi:hypothetical protein
MNAKLPIVLILSAVLTAPLFLAACEESHTETTHENLLGGETHKETTVYKNPVTGETTVDRQTSTTH